MHLSIAVITMDSPCRYFKHKKQGLIFAILSSPQTQKQLSSKKPTYSRTIFRFADSVASFLMTAVFIGIHIVLPWGCDISILSSQESIVLRLFYIFFEFLEFSEPLKNYCQWRRMHHKMALPCWAVFITKLFTASFFLEGVFLCLVPSSRMSRWRGTCIQTFCHFNQNTCWSYLILSFLIPAKRVHHFTLMKLNSVSLLSSNQSSTLIEYEVLYMYLRRFDLLTNTCNVYLLVGTFQSIWCWCIR
jgi:hypothetical protein